MLLVVLLGVVLILVARNERSDNAPAGPPRLGDHWHSLYAIYDCDEFILDVYPNDIDDQSGIHTHGDGLIHIHPFHTGVTGQFATIGAFANEIEIELTDSRFELPDGTFLDESGEGCPAPDSEDPDDSEDSDGENRAAELRILRWETLQAEKALTFTEDLRGVRFLNDGQIFVIAYVHPSVDHDDVPRPDDTFLRSYLNLPAEEQPLVDDPEMQGPLPEGGESEPTEGDVPEGEVPETTEPAESGPAESGPAESGPAESGPAESGPAESGPAESGPAESEPAGSTVPTDAEDSPTDEEDSMGQDRTPAPS